jgi:hypothetical protein
VRRRYVQRRQEDGSYKLEEVDVNYWSPRRNLSDTDALISDRHYDGMQATDGADISTRAKHREYMRRHSLTTIDDFTGHWKTHHRTEELKDSKKRRETIERTIARLDPP